MHADSESAAGFSPRPFILVQTSLYLGSLSWLQGKGAKPKSKPKVGCIWKWNAWIWFLYCSIGSWMAAWRNTNSNEKSHSITIPSAEPQAHGCVCSYALKTFALLKHFGWSVTQTLCIYNILNSLLLLVSTWWCSATKQLSYFSTTCLHEMIVYLVCILKILILCPRNSQ